MWFAASGCAWIGFGTDESPTEPVETTEGVWVWQYGDLSIYHRITVDEVELVTPPGIVMARDVREKLVRQMRREVVVRLANHFEVIEPGGAGVLRLTIRVRDVRPGVAMGMAGAWVEAQVTDSVTNELLVTIRDTRSHTHRVKATLATEWEAARDVMISWSDEIRHAIEQLREGESGSGAGPLLGGPLTQ